MIEYYVHKFLSFYFNVIFQHDSIHDSCCYVNKRKKRRHAVLIQIECQKIIGQKKKSIKKSE